MPMTYDEYQNKRSWLVDTAETPADQKRLKAQLEKLKAQYEAGKKAAATKKPDPSNTKPFNVRLIKPSEIIKDKPKAKAKAAGRPYPNLVDNAAVKRRVN